MKSKVDKLDVYKLVPVPVDLSDAAKNDVVKKDVHNAKIKDIEDKIPDNTNLAANITLNKIPSITNLATNTTLTAAENKILDHSKYVTTPEFNKLTAENFTARLKHSNLATKFDITDFVKKTDFSDKPKKT